MAKLIVVVALTLLVAASAFAAEGDVAKGLKTLAEVHDLARIFELRHAMPSAPMLGERLDPWGTSYRFEEDTAGYRIVSAGSDLTFDETSWTKCEQFDGTEGDVVFESGTICRTNRHWLYERIASDANAQAALDELRRAEMQFMVIRTPVAQALTLIKLTTAGMQGIGELIEAHRKQHGDLSRLERSTESMAALLSRPATGAHPLTHDAWGTPFRLVIEGSNYKLVSASADREFKPASWTTVPQADVGEDIVYSNGKLVRAVVESEVLDQAKAQMMPLRQPAEARRSAASPYERVGGGVKAPVVANRVEPVYPEEYRRIRISGIVILEVAITDKGVVEDVRVLKSVAPDMDMAAVTAVRQWKFEPAQRDGRPVPVLFNLTINFLLK